MHKIIRIISVFLTFVFVFSIGCGASVESLQSLQSIQWLYSGVVIFENQHEALWMIDYDYCSVVLNDVECNDNHQERWEIIYDSSSGYYRIRNLKSGSFLTAPSTVSGMATLEARDNSDIFQLWEFSTTPNCYFTISPAYNYGSTEYVLVSSVSPDFYGYNLVLEEYCDDYTMRDEWDFLYAGALMVGIPDPTIIENPDGTVFQHDHRSSLERASELLYNIGYRSLSLYWPLYTDEARNECLRYMQYVDYFAFRGHGSFDANLNQSSIIVRNSSGNLMPIEITSAQIYNYNFNVVVTDMSNCNLAAFVACNTAGYTVRDETGEVIQRVQLTHSLPFAAVDAGANYAIGFMDEIYCTAANYWTETFFECYLNDPEYIDWMVWDLAEEVALSYGNIYDETGNLDSIWVCVG